ncbi:MAG: 1-acyl-sn-glycerol-3-phosphate acyltransferase [Bacteroidales bacterium]|nr:1-acyl-sn-glycerol-3-phosphate acyltransferase [Bacteroidales bacterium]
MMLLYRLYQICFMLPVLLVATLLTAIMVIIGSLLGGGNWWGYYPPMLWSRLFCLLSFVRVTVRGRENIDKKISYVFVANHQGAYDIFSIYGYLGHNFRWMMKASLRNIPVVGYACHCAKQIYVDKSSPSALRSTMERAEKVLSGGMSLVVFPEGARSWNGRMRAFKRGAYMLATEFNLPVVPLTVDGSFDVMPRFKKLPVPGHIILTIHKPVYPPKDGYNLPDLMQQTFDTIGSALPEGYRPDGVNDGTRNGVISGIISSAATDNKRIN